LLLDPFASNSLTIRAAEKRRLQTDLNFNGDSCLHWHSLIQEGVSFHQLGLRSSMNNIALSPGARAELRARFNPDVLVMTATHPLARHDCTAISMSR
jgi:RecG-like helicase